MSGAIVMALQFLCLVSFSAQSTGRPTCILTRKIRAMICLHDIDSSPNQT